MIDRQLNATENDEWAVLLGIVLLIVGYIIYLSVTLQVQGFPARPQEAPKVIAGVLLLGVLGGLAAESWGRGIHTPAVIAIGGLSLRPWLIPSPLLFRQGYLLFLVVLALFGGLVELLVRFPRLGEEYIASKPGNVAAAVGIAHLICGLGLQFYVGRFRLFAVTGLGSLVVVALYYAVCGLGLVVLGALPVVCWHYWRLRGPLVVASGWFLWGVYGIWQSRSRFPVSSFAGMQWQALRPYPDYLFQWSVVLVVVVVGAWIEWRIRRTAASQSLWT